MVLSNIQNNGEIDQSDEILKLLYDICMKKDHSDVTFIIENTKIPAHKTILSARSSYFHTLLCGDFAEAKQTQIELKVSLDPFKAILKFIYTGCLSLAVYEIDQITELYGLTEEYGLNTLQNTILDYLISNLTIENCVSILNAAHLYTLVDLQSACMKFIDCYSTELLNHETFKELSPKSLLALLKRDAFYAPEIEIFKSVCNWSTNNPNVDIKELHSVIRWSQMTVEDLMDTVFPSKILDQSQLMNLMMENKRCRTPCSEKYAEENIATAEHGAKVISGENPSAILSGNYTNYGVNEGCTYHTIESYIDDYNKKPREISEDIIVDLGKVRFINYIEFLLMDRDSRKYSYHIEVSADGKQYTKLIDRTTNYYRSWQNLCFPSRPVQFIKLLGTQCDGRTRSYRNCSGVTRDYPSFEVVCFQAMYKIFNYPELVDGVIKPKKNVASIAYVVNGGGGNNMLNENTHEFTCQEFGSHILVQLNQAYHIDSLRMFLGNNMNHLNQYSFYIETSMNKENWKMAVDKRNESLSEWQEFEFEPRSAMFIKLTGTQEDVSFICTYFECPRNPEKPKLKRPIQ